MNVAVFGSGSCLPESEEYSQAEKVGRFLGMLVEVKGADIVLVNGGYNGVMEASAKGFKQASGKVVVGYTLPEKPEGNPFVASVPCQSFWERRGRLLETPDCIIIIPNAEGPLFGEGTFDELAGALNGHALDRKLNRRQYGKQIIVLCSADEQWIMLLTGLNCLVGNLPALNLERACSPEEAVAMIRGC